MEAIEDIAFGATFLGCGGGGHTYIAELQLAQALAEGADIEVIAADDLNDDDLAVAVGRMGAPSVQKEKYPNGEEGVAGLQQIERLLGKPVSAIFPVEIGGQNGLSAFLLAAQCGLPVVDCDGMGRAFPEAHMVSFNIFGCRASPVVFTDESGTCVSMEFDDNSQEERLGRSLTVAMGGSCHVIDYPLTGRELKQFAVKESISVARGIGRSVRNAKRNGQDLFQAIFSYLNGVEGYQHAFSLFDGKIIDLQRGIENGFSKGRVILEGIEGQQGRFEIEIQNENLIARQDGRVVAMVPDIISILDIESAETINTENLKYGQRVKVVGTSVPALLRMPEALKILGPSAFSMNCAYQPIEKIANLNG